MPCLGNVRILLGWGTVAKGRGCAAAAGAVAQNTGKGWEQGVLDMPWSCG